MRLRKTGKITETVDLPNLFPETNTNSHKHTKSHVHVYIYLHAFTHIFTNTLHITYTRTHTLTYTHTLSLANTHSVNFPLRDGIDDNTHKSIFEPVMRRIMEQYQPGAIFLQCGADSLVGDRCVCVHVCVCVNI